jgi:multiple antibiotic resistance protein
VFQITRGVMITTIGYGMFAPGSASAATAEQEGSSGESSSLDPIMLFAASPCTISTVLALSVMVLRPGSSAGRHSSLISRFLGLILIAMGLQLVLTNLRAFFQAAG